MMAAETADATELPSADGSIRHTLRTPIIVPGDAKNPKVSMTEIVMRQPTGGDIARYGMPVKFNPFGDGQEIAFNERAMTSMISGLAGLPTVSLSDMDPRDWTSIAWKLAGFFLPTA